MELLASITPHQWYIIGGLLACIPGVIGIVEWVKAHHFKVKAEKLWSGFIVLNVAFWSFILTAVDALSNNLSQITHFGSLIPQIAPFVATWGPRVSVTALLVHSVASVLIGWWKDRQAKKPITNVNLPDFAPLVQATTSTSTVTGQPSSSLGTVSTDVTPPPANVFN